jgi:hypothetical protein
MCDMLLVSRNLWTTPEPNVYPAPLQCELEPCGVKSKQNEPRGDCKVFFFRIRIGPDEVGHWTFVWYL